MDDVLSDAVKARPADDFEMLFLSQFGLTGPMDDQLVVSVANTLE